MKVFATEKAAHAAISLSGASGDGPTTRKWITVPETCLIASNDRPNIARNLIHRPTNAALQQSSENNLNFASEKESQCQ